MKRMIALCIVFVMFFSTACGKKAPTWQEQYDLGLRYLSEGNYQEAIIAFTSAIEIDPKQAPAYVGRGDAYVALGDEGDNLANAEKDYKKAIELDPEISAAYLGLAYVFILQDDIDKAEEILEEGFNKTQSDDLAKKLEEIRSCDHEWQPANYQQPKTCNVCGETQGEPLPAALARVNFAELDTTHDYTTLCWNDPTALTVGSVSVSDVKVIDSDDTHEPKEGYTWTLFTLAVHYNDDNARAFGFQTRTADIDFYTGESIEYAEAESDEEGNTFTVNYYGKDYECFTRTDRFESPEWTNNGKYSYWDFAYQIPAGYDGIVIIAYSAEYKKDGEDNFDYEGALNDGNTVLFRLKQTGIAQETAPSTPSGSGSSELTAPANSKDNIAWTFDNDGTLTVSGIGPIAAFDDLSAIVPIPWDEHTSNITKIIIKDGITRIGNNTFANCINLETAAISDTVESIGEYAFARCLSLTKLTIPKNIKSLEPGLFMNCPSLTSVEIPNGVETIGSYTFGECSNLVSLSIPSSVRTIGMSAFYACDNLKDVYYSGSEEQWNSITIENGNKNLLNSTIHYAS